VSSTGTEEVTKQETAEAPTTAQASRRSWVPHLQRGEWIRAAIIVGLLLFVLFALPARLSGYWRREEEKR
jgi:hypothetical protein